MNPFLNPIKGLPFLKNFIFDPGRLERWSPEKIKKYKDSVIRKKVKYTYTVPVYYKKYKKAGIRPNDIQSIEDINKLPFISKKELIDEFPEGVIPESYNKKNANIVSTGGSTGKPISLFTDFSVTSGGIGAGLRLLTKFDLNWRTSRLVSIGNFSPGKADAVSHQVLYSKAKALNFLNNYIFISAFDPIKEIMDYLNKFKPEMILSYPSTFRNLAYLKKKGLGDNINPKILIACGSVLDEYTKSYIEDSFGCRIINLYGSTEACAEAPIAVECLEGIWHINQDYFHVESIDENMNLVGEGERGHLVLTRLFGKATPFIRYTGMDDWITLTYDYECSCGLRTPIIKGGVAGRVSGSIITPEGIIYPGASFANIHAVLTKLKTHKVQQFQIIQKRIDEIDINLIIDDDLRIVGPSVDLIFNEIKKIHQEKAGPNIKINVNEVKEIKSEKDKPAPLIISKLSMEQRKKALLK